MRTIKHLTAAVFGVMTALTSCYDEVDLGDYRDKECESLLTLNSLVCPDSTVAVAATSMYFFSDIHNERTFVEGLNIRLDVNGTDCGAARYDNITHLYHWNMMPEPGDRITMTAMYNDKEVTATDVVPQCCCIESIEVERKGPMPVYTNHDFIVTYGITFSDNPDEDNYYFLQWDAVDNGKDVHMGERDFTREYVFQRLAEMVEKNLPGWTPYSPYGLPFTDNGINGQRHTLVVDEIIQGGNGNRPWLYGQMKRKFKLYAISKPYYDYLVSVLLNQTDDKGLEGGMIDLGIADPIKIYSNISHGTGILGCYNESSLIVDVIQVVGAFPDANSMH